MTVSRYKVLQQRLTDHIALIYPEANTEELVERMIAVMAIPDRPKAPRWMKNNWSEKDVALITYANSVVREGEAPLDTLQYFLRKYLSDTVSWVHILPFFPYSSDDGFSVIDYTQVNDAFGDWQDIEAIGKRFQLMADLVINHCSGMSRWFEQFKQARAPGRDYFIAADPELDWSEVVRPRTSPLFREVTDVNGKTHHLWCTFSHDQLDLDFSNPEVLIEMLRIIRLYLDRGVRIFRLDAVAFLWKRPGTSCINLDETHEIVRLIRTLVEYAQPGTILITETNIPNRENLSYFGNANEAHLVYNFSLPPLLLYTLVTGDCHALKNWLMSMPPARNGTTFFNFIASHDGIGLRPLEGLLSDDDMGRLIAAMEGQGGRVSWRQLSDGGARPYEINIALFDALRGTLSVAEDGFQEDRFIAAHTIMLGIEGVPAFYIHSLLATGNDVDKLAHTNNNRAINRHNWSLDSLEDLLASQTSHARMFSELQRRIQLRRQQPAFHPNAIMYTLHLGDRVLAYWRQSSQRDQSIFCLNNVTSEEQRVPRSSLNLIDAEHWVDLLSGKALEEGMQELVLAPYESLWLSNTVQRGQGS